MSGVHTVQDGQFVRSGLPESVIVLEFLKKGSQPRVLLRGREIEVGDLGIQVTMEQGPYSGNESVWEAVTRFPEGDPGPAEMPRYGPLLGSIDHWYAVAAGERES